MFICICKQITDRQIRDAVKNGATSFSDVQTSLGVATKCGECKHHARQCMRQGRKQTRSNIPLEEHTITETLINIG